ncbi:hypothetical protein [Paracoccus sp. (in: a-proteobacteria)]|uniref:hypothetical protein n=1 Tax=Paracoccus sp. TaxID=267 RepID=UPI004057FC01
MHLIIREISDALDMQSRIDETIVNLPLIGGGTGSGQDGRGIVSESYDSSTGILTLTFSDGATYSTGDLRGTSANVVGFSTDAEAITHASANPNDLVYSTEGS